MQSLTLAPARTAPVPDLVAVLAARDAAALSQVYAEHRAVLCSFCVRLLGDQAAAEDLVHDVFVRLPELIHKLEAGRSLRAFLLGIAANRAKHYLRAASRRRRLAEGFAQEPNHAPSQPDRVAEQRWIARSIARALEHLPTEQQVAFVLAEMEGQDAATIASRLSIPEATARTRLFHARRKLRAILTAWGLVAVFVASAAFAASQPAIRAAVVTRVQAWFGSGGGTPARSQRLPTRPLLVNTPPTGPAETAPAQSTPEPAVLSLDALPVLEPDHTKPARAARVAPPAASSSPASSSPASSSAELERYREAHRTHFDGADPTASLLAWDRYLAEFPASSFATDARFNRALCLIRLGHHAQARSALQPFADAPPGSYRQREAASLLEGLNQPGTSATK